MENKLGNICLRLKQLSSELTTPLEKRITTANGVELEIVHTIATELLDEIDLAEKVSEVDYKNLKNMLANMFIVGAGKDIQPGDEEIKVIITNELKQDCYSHYAMDAPSELKVLVLEEAAIQFDKCIIENAGDWVDKEQLKAKLDKIEIKYKQPEIKE